MNTIGKILVILNFLFAIIVGVLLVMDFAKRNQWKEAYFALKKETETAVDVAKADKVATVKVAGDYKDAKSQIDKLMQDLKDSQTLTKIEVDKLTVEKGEAQAALEKATTTNKQLEVTQQRLTNEIAHLNVIVKERETAIVRFEAEIKKYRNDAVQATTLAKTRQIQNENLLEQIRNLTSALAKAQAGIGGGAGEAAGARDPNSPNPPAVVVNGKIEKVDGTDLVLLSLGTDNGVAKGNTLDVYRTQPEPKYLGMVRIIDANHHQSVARLVPTANAAFRAQLREGDLVTSKLIR